MQRYSHLVDGVDDALNEIGTQLDTLTTKQEHRELKAVADKIHNYIIYAMMALSVICSVGIGTYAWISKDIEDKIHKQTEQIIKSRPEQMRQGGELYWVDEKGVQRKVEVRR